MDEKKKTDSRGAGRGCAMRILTLIIVIFLGIAMAWGFTFLWAAITGQ